MPQLSSLRCPRSQCDNHGKRLYMDVGADDVTGRGDLTVRHWCDCGYAEFGPSSVESARRTSRTVAEVYARILAQRQRLDTGVVVPLRKDTESWPEVADV